MKRIVILGAGESGAGAAVLAKKEGFDVFVSDMSKIGDKYKKQLDDHQIEWEEGQHTEEKILNADEIIKSPGIPETAPLSMKRKLWMTWESHVMYWKMEPSRSIRRMWDWSQGHRRRVRLAVSTEEGAEQIRHQKPRSRAVETKSRKVAE